MSRIYEDSVVVVRNSKGEIALQKATKADIAEATEGTTGFRVWTAADIGELVVYIANVVKDKKLPLSKWAIYEPKGNTGDYVLIANRFGQPMILRQGKGQGSSKRLERL